MAAADVVARRYAEAYFDLARQAGRIEAWRDDLARAVEMLENPSVAEALRTPRVHVRDRVRLLMDLLDGLQQPTRNLVRLLVERGRAGALPVVLSRYEALADAASGVTRAQVVAAVPIDEALERRIAEVLGERLGGRVRTTLRQDPDLIGGLVIRIGDRVIDSSLRTRLQQLRAALA
jgi:F-type H+-transporting ATPase subunit delta